MTKRITLDEGTRRTIAETKRLVLDLNRTAEDLAQKLDLLIESLHAEYRLPEKSADYLGETQGYDH